MAIENEELMQKFVRTGIIMRHIDGEGPCPHKHGHGRYGGRGHGCHDEVHGHGEGRDEPGCCSDTAHGHGPHAHGHGRGHGKRRRGQARVLTMVAMQEGISQKDLAFLLGIRPQTLGEMLGKLEERGLVARGKSAADARVVEVTLTDEGRARAAEIAEHRKLVATDLFAVLTEEEKEQLASILDKLGAELDKRRPRRHCKHAGEDDSAEE